MANKQVYGQPTLFGGDIKGFRYVFEPRLLEDVYRVEEDPLYYLSRANAVDDLFYLRKIATKFGLSGDDFDQILEDLSGPTPNVSGFIEDEFDGDLRAWMDTSEARVVIFDDFPSDGALREPTEAFGNAATLARFRALGGHSLDSGITGHMYAA